MAHQVTLQWVGGEHAFALPIGQLRAVQDACNAGPIEILTGLRLGSWRVDWPLAVLRHGLVGGGMDTAAARDLVSRMADAHPLTRLQIPALLVLSAALVGDPDDPAGEETGELSPPENGGSADSTPTEPKQDSAPGMST